MPAEPGFYEDVMQMLTPLGDVTGRSMFGGYGVFESGRMFALISGATLYFKVDDTSRARYEDASSAQFNPMPYWEVPADVLESEPELEEWAREAITIAHAAPEKARRRS